MNPGCWICLHYNQRFYKYTTGQRNVSGGVAWYGAWAKHRCNLKQEDKYPRHCDFKKNEVLQAELDERYPDLAEARRKERALWVELVKKFPDLVEAGR